MLCAFSQLSQIRVQRNLSAAVAAASPWERDHNAVAEVTALETLIGLLRECRQQKNLLRAQHLYAYICIHRLEYHAILGNYLVPLLADCGSLPEAEYVFDRLPCRNVYSWTSLISSYGEASKPQLSFLLYQRMQREQVLPNNYTFIALLKSSARLHDLDTHRLVHSVIIKRGMETDLFIGDTLIDMYGDYGCHTDALRVFDRLPNRDVVSWNSLIAGYAEHGLAEDALTCIEKMQLEGVYPDNLTHCCYLKACGSIGDIQKGHWVFAQILKHALERDAYVVSAIVDMYGQCDAFAEAYKVLVGFCCHNTVSWTSLMSKYAEHGHGKEALKCFLQMQEESVSPDSVAFICALKACSTIGALERGHLLCAEILQKGWETSFLVGNAVVDMYMRCESLAEAERMFSKLHVKGVELWNALIVGYAEYGLGERALNCFKQMQRYGVCPNDVTFPSSIKACALVGALDVGRNLHAEVCKRGFEKGCFIGSAIVDMYCKCGLIAEGQEVFDKLHVRDVVSWNTLIKGYGENHQVDKAVQCFENMQNMCVKPDGITFMCLLAACSHSSLVVKGREYFDSMKEHHGIEPSMEHCTYMVDLLARSGHVNEAVRFAESMQCVSSAEILRVLLTSCKTHGDLDMGLSLFQQLVLLNEEDATSYMLIADVYASAGKWNDAEEIEQMRKHAGARKKPGSASIVMMKDLNEFVVGDHYNVDISTVIESLNSCLKGEGYVNLSLKSYTCWGQ